MATSLATPFNFSPTRAASFKGGITPRKLKHITEFVYQNLEQEFSLATLAKEVQMGESYFARVFKQTVGVPPYQFVLHCKINKAKELLTETRLPLVEISYILGFSSQSHFTSVFHKQVGMTPKSFRLQRFE